MAAPQGINYRFEIGHTYGHTFEGEPRATFLCTARDGDKITLKELGGKGRTFTGQATRAETWDGYNECLRVGIIPCKGYNLIDSIAAHDFLEAEE